MCAAAFPLCDCGCRGIRSHADNASSDTHNPRVYSQNGFGAYLVHATRKVAVKESRCIHAHKLFRPFGGHNSLIRKEFTRSSV